MRKYMHNFAKYLHKASCAKMKKVVYFCEMNMHDMEGTRI